MVKVDCNIGLKIGIREKNVHDSSHHHFLDVQTKVLIAIPGFYPENFNKGGWKTLEDFWKTLEKQGRPPLKNKNSSDLGHFEIKFGEKGKNYFF